MGTGLRVVNAATSYYSFTVFRNVFLVIVSSANLEYFPAGILFIVLSNIHILSNYVTIWVGFILGPWADKNMPR